MVCTLEEKDMLSKAFLWKKEYFEHIHPKYKQKNKKD
jgi:hypothetical protein